MTQERMVKLRRLAVVMTAIASVTLWIVDLTKMPVQAGLPVWLLRAAVILCVASFWTAVILTFRIQRASARR
jgi:hypothetical protein